VGAAEDVEVSVDDLFVVVVVVDLATPSLTARVTWRMTTVEMMEVWHLEAAAEVVADPEASVEVACVAVAEVSVVDSADPSEDLPAAEAACEEAEVVVVAAVGVAEAAMPMAKARLKRSYEKLACNFASKIRRTVKKVLKKNVEKAKKNIHQCVLLITNKKVTPLQPKKRSKFFPFNRREDANDHKYLVLFLRSLA